MSPFRGPKHHLVVQRILPGKWTIWVFDVKWIKLRTIIFARKRSPSYTPLKLDLLPLAPVAAPVQPEVDQVHF